FHLARPALAGTIFKEEPLSVDALLDAGDKVVPLHQQR
ncbi:MAG: EAL domain-containing protein, partial [Mesorhizobium sp.]